MHVQPHQRLDVRGPGLRKLMGAAFVASFICLLAAIPAGSAVASTGEGTVEVTTPISLPTTPTDVLDPLLATVPVNDLNVKDLDPAQLSQMLGGLLDLKGTRLTSLVTDLTPLLTTELTGNPHLTLGELTEGGLLGGVLTLLGLNSSKLTPNEVVAGLLGSVSEPAQASKMVEQLLSQLGKSLQIKDPAEVKSLVEELLGGLNSGELAALESTLGVGSLTPAALTTKVTELLGSGSTAQIETVVHELLGGLAFDPSTLGGLATQLGTSVETLAKDLGTSVETLSGGLGLTVATALPTLIAPLANGTLLTVLDGPEGLKITTLESKETSGKETTKEKEAKESRESKEAKERSEAVSPGSSGSSGSTSVVVNLPAAAAASTPGSNPALAAKTVAKIKILSHRVKGHVATLVLQIPAAGKVVVSGGGVRAVGKGATKAERMTVRIPLSKAGTASLRKRHNRLSVALKASFKPTSGSSSSAGVTVHFA
jgi:hypothetical protein